MWEQVAELFKSALDHDEEEWTSFLESACPHDFFLRAEVQSLLAHHRAHSPLLDTPAIHLAAESLAGAEPGRAGEIVGDYEILSLIGSGGMGDVYLARDTTLERKVALKLIRRGMDSDDIIHRFRQEERLLASLNHPNIAQLYGGGITSDGVPFFAMEYVQGTRIDQYCDGKQLTILRRLELFRQVCAAVHYAHQHLVVHRDIKPSNILVTAEGEPKLLDFGIGKLLDATGTELQTLTISTVMTPEYASPEHARGETITTASDTYSLGILLYELLCGDRPYRINTTAR